MRARVRMRGEVDEGEREGGAEGERVRVKGEARCYSALFSLFLLLCVHNNLIVSDLSRTVEIKEKEADCVECLPLLQLNKVRGSCA